MFFEGFAFGNILPRGCSRAIIDGRTAFRELF